MPRPLLPLHEYDATTKPVDHQLVVTLVSFIVWIGYRSSSLVPMQVNSPRNNIPGLVIGVRTSVLSTPVHASIRIRLYDTDIPLNLLLSGGEIRVMLGVLLLGRSGTGI